MAGGWRNFLRRILGVPPLDELPPAKQHTREDDSTDVTRMYKQMRTAAEGAEEAAERLEQKATSVSTRMSKESYDRLMLALAADNDDDADDAGGKG